MALEQATPTLKGNLAAGSFGSISPFPSADGNRILFVSPAALGDTEGLENPPPVGDRYVATRGANGWFTTALAPPASYGFGYGGSSGASPPVSFTPALDRWLSMQSTVAQAQNGQMTAYEANLAGTWTPRSGLLTPLNRHYDLNLIRKGSESRYLANSADFSRYFLRPASGNLGNLVEESNQNYEASYLPGDPTPTSTPNTKATWNSYVLTDRPGQPQLALLARGADVEHGGAVKAFGANCGAVVGGGGTSGEQGGRNQGAVSADGTRVFFSTRPAQLDGVACPFTATATTVNNSNLMPLVTPAKGTGTTSTTGEADKVTDVVTTTGKFLVGQTVTISGSTVAPNTTITAIEGDTITLSNPVTAGAGTGKEIKAGALPFAVGQEVSTASGSLPPGTTITAVAGQTITLSNKATATSVNTTLTGLNPMRIMQRTEEGGEAKIAELVPGGPAAGSDNYEGASEDQTKVYFTSPRKLAPTDLDPGAGECSARVRLPVRTSTGCDLYLYDSTLPEGERVIQISAGEATAAVEATADTEAGSNQLRSVVTTTGTGELSAAAGSGDTSFGQGIGTYTAGANVVTGVNVLIGALEVGQTLTSTRVPSGTTITGISGTSPNITLTLSANATSSGGFTLTAGASNKLTNVSETEGALAPGQTISAARMPANTTITAVSGASPNITLTLSANATAKHTGTALTAASKQVTGVSTSSGAFVPGQGISGPGIPAGTTIASAGAGTLQLSAAPTAAGSGTQPLAAGAAPIGVGDEISGPGIPAGALVTAVAGQTVTISQNAEATASGVAVTAGHASGSAANVYQGVTAISGDGSRVYFAAQGVLTSSPNPEGDVAAADGLNLYLYQRNAAHPGGSLSFVAGLDATCTTIGGPTEGPDCGNITSSTTTGAGVVGSILSYWNEARTAPMRGDGHVLFFQSTAALTANDQDGKRRDLFRYDGDASPPSLECVSCLPGGAPDDGQFDTVDRELRLLKNPGTQFAEQSSWASEDGASAVFATEQALLPTDTDGRLSNYLWRAGQLTLLPGTGRRPSISHDGRTVAFETAARLLPSDGDTAVDTYVARVNGGYAEAQPPAPCVGEACQGPPSVTPPATPPASRTLNGNGNVKKQKVKRKKHTRKAHKNRCRGKKANKQKKKKHCQVKKGKRGSRDARPGGQGADKGGKQ